MQTPNTTYGGAEASPMDAYTAWQETTRNCMLAASTAWLQTARHMSSAILGPDNPMAAGAAAMQTFIDACKPEPAAAEGRSWYRPLASADHVPATAQSRWLPAEVASELVQGMPWQSGWPMSGAGDAWWLSGSVMPGSRTLAMMAFPFAAMPNPWSGTWLAPWAAAWMEGASRAALAEPVAKAAEMMRSPDASIPFVSYRSDNGFAVAQIAYSTTRIATAAAPAAAMLLGTWLQPFGGGGRST